MSRILSQDFTHLPKNKKSGNCDTMLCVKRNSRLSRLGWQTFFFMLSGYLLSGILVGWFLSDIHYQKDIGESYPLAWDSGVFGLILTILLGFLITGICFWLKFYRWRLAWGVMFLVCIGLGFVVWHFEKRPEAVIARTFGRFADDLDFEALVVDGSYESSYKAFRMAGNAEQFQEALQKTFSGEFITKPYFATERLPDFMRSSSPIISCWAYSNCLYAWKTEDGKYYLLTETWNNFHEQEWERMIQETKP
ncbi:MAG: hypothetical protein BWX73_03397 [Lentisphaerae bacterium ADurb.Bin082]|nr:MAG: hypothetical protein BWX73_03397 [Lentisphaerae bacterium ADurb.Bin082]